MFATREGHRGNPVLRVVVVVGPAVVLQRVAVGVVGVRRPVTECVGPRHHASRGVVLEHRDVTDPVGPDLLARVRVVRELDARELPLIEALRTLRLLHYPCFIWFRQERRG